MSTPQIKRFRVNPVELAIFLIVSLIFGNSVYNLFYDRQGFRPTALAPMEANPISEGRAPASVKTSQTFLNLEIKCGAPAEENTAATKVRLTGPLCGAVADEQKLVKTQISNDANKFNATVFPHSGRFSTDYIPLNAGKNPIRMEFTFQGGRSFSQDLVINKEQ